MRNGRRTRLISASRRCLCAGLGSIALAAALDAQPAQQVHRRDFAPASDAVFQVALQFFDQDASQPLAARTVDRWEEGEERHEKIVFTTGSGERVPGDLVLPGQGQAPFPAVLLLHGLGSDRDFWWRDDRRELPDRLLAAGVAVLAIDLELHGERSARNDYQSPVYLTLGDTRFVRSRDMVIHSTLDARRALAYLAERSDIDPQRLAVVGYSMGAMIATFLAVLEPQLVTVVACALPTTPQPIAIDPFEFAPRIRLPLLLLIGRDDWLSSPEDARHLLELVPAEERDLRFYDAGHTLPPAFATDAVSWLTSRLAPEESRGRNHE